MGFALCLMVSMNLLHGPRDTGQRRWEMRSALTGLYESGIPPEEVVLFMAGSERIAENSKATGHEFSDQEDEHVQAWRLLCANRRMTVADGRRTNLCRFGGLPHAIMTHVGSWHIDSFERNWVSLELDMLGNRKLIEHIKLTEQAQQAEQVGENSGSTSLQRSTVDDKVLKDCCQNGMAISVMVLQERSNERKMQILAVMSSCVLSLHTIQKRELRCSEISLKFWEQQVNGAYLDHINCILGVYRDPVVLAKCRFACTSDEAKRLGEDMVSENEFAELLGSQQALLAGARLKRHLMNIAGWPHMWLGART